MPARDNTGPTGQGPMTGRGAGRCASDNINNAPGFGRGRGAGRGMGCGMGRGQGFGRNVTPAPTREQQIETLKTQLAQLESQNEYGGL